MSKVAMPGVGRGNNPNSNNIIGVETRTPAQGVNNKLPDAFHNDIDPQRTLVREKPVHRLMAYMAANGFENVEIARATGHSANHVSTVIKQPFMRMLIQAEQRNMAGDFRKEIVEQGQAAFHRIVDLSENARSENIKADLSKYLVDRYLGRPTQPVETVGKPASDMTDDELKQALGTVLEGQPSRIQFDGPENALEQKAPSPSTDSFDESVSIYDT